MGEKEVNFLLPYYIKQYIMGDFDFGTNNIERNYGKRVRSPDFLEISNTMYSCGECGTLLDQVFMYPATNKEQSWLACYNCGWHEREPPMPAAENDWYNNRYGRHSYTSKRDDYGRF